MVHFPIISKVDLFTRAYGMLKIDAQNKEKKSVNIEKIHDQLCNNGFQIPAHKMDGMQTNIKNKLTESNFITVNQSCHEKKA